MTSHWCDFQNTDFILHCGSNSCENHPVSSKWLNKAHERGAKWIVVDPRYTRTAELADIYCPIRSGTDIAFYGGMYNYIIENLIEPNLAEYLKTGERCSVYNFEYLLNYTNASYLLDPEYEFDVEKGLFSGWDEETKTYSNHSWHYQTDHEEQWDTSAGGAYAWAVAEGVPEFTKPTLTVPKKDMTLSDPMCVYQQFKKHYSRYTLDVVCDICGMTKENLELVYSTYTQSAAPDKSGMILYALGQTQHTYGAQNTRSMCIMQLLLGNIGVPGGGVNALRGEPNVQGATDMGMMVNEHPAYLKWANTTDRSSLRKYLESQTYSDGYYTNKPKFLVSSLKEWFGENATVENDYGFDWWPKVPSVNGKADGKWAGDYTHISTFEWMDKGVMKGYFAWGMNPCHSGPNAKHIRQAMANLDWLVVADQVETETAGFWHAPDMDPSKIDTTVYFMPCALIYEKPGTILNSGRWTQWRYQAVEPWDDSKTDLEMCDLLWKAIVDLYKKEGGANPDPILKTKWDYYVDGKISFYPVTWALNGYNIANSTFEGNGGIGFSEGPNGTLSKGNVDLLSGYAKLGADGSTACAMWIYSGYYSPAEGQPKDRPLDPHTMNVGRRNTVDKSGLGLNSEWAFSWPSNRRILYNRNASDVSGTPWNPEKVLNYWDEAAGKWVIIDQADFVASKTNSDGTTEAVRPNNKSFFMLWEQNARLESYGMDDGPLPEFYEPTETPFEYNTLNGRTYAPCALHVDSFEATRGTVADFPYVATTYSVTEHWQTGGQTRACPALVEAIPDQFVEMSYELAEELGIQNGDDVIVYNNRSSCTVKALVTHRFKPFTVHGKVQHQVGLTHHFGYTHEFAQGDVVNELTPNIGDAVVQTPEYKAFLVNIKKAPSGGVK